MDTISTLNLIVAATLAVAAVALGVALARTIGRDGFGSRPAPDPQADWGTASMPSRPYSSRL